MYTAEEKYCILLGELGIAAKKFFLIKEYLEQSEVNAFGSVDNAVREIIGDGYDKVRNAVNNKLIDKVLANMEKYGVVASTWYSESFPDSLRTIDDPPYVLFCKGNVSLLKNKCFAVIGTRKASAYGRRVAKDFTAVLSERFTIVSGLAYGIDAIAHETCLQEDGSTIAVLGGGLINIYPSGNQGLADNIVKKNGLIVTEYGLTAQPLSYRFPHRNRIVSGLSKGLLVCQAPSKSGTNSTVELALDQGKDIFVVPGEIYDTGYAGSNLLIKSMQGSCVTNPRDILSYYNMDEDSAEKAVYQLSIEEQIVVNALSDGQLNFDQIMVKTKIQPSELYFLLANLELKSIIVKLPGNFYRLYGGLE